jgi:hypothetical protein
MAAAARCGHADAKACFDDEFHRLVAQLALRVMAMELFTGAIV